MSNTELKTKYAKDDADYMRLTAENEANRAAAETHNCKEAGCNVDPQGKVIVK